MKRILLVLLISVIFILTAIPLPITRAATLYVGSTASCGVSTVYSDVSSAIAAAVDGDTIVLCENVAEVTPLITINKMLTIDGVNGYVWYITDTDPTNPAIQITSSVTLKNLRIYFTRGSTPEPPLEWIKVSQAYLAIENTYIRTDLDVTKNIRVISTDRSDLILRRTTIVLNNLVSPRPFASVIEGINSFVYIYSSDLSQGTWGYGMNLVYNTPAPEGYEVTIKNSTMEFYSAAGINLYLTDGANVDMVISDSRVKNRERGIQIRLYTFSWLELNITNSTIESSYDIGIYMMIISSSSANLYINPSTVTGMYTGISVGVTSSSRYNMIIRGSEIYAPLGPGLSLSTYLNSSSWAVILNSEIKSNSGYAARFGAGNYAMTDVTFRNSVIDISRIIGTQGDGFGAIVSFMSESNFTFIETTIKARTNPISVTSREAMLKLHIIRSFLDSLDGEAELYAEARDNGFIDIRTENSVVGVFSLTGVGFITMSLIESVYNEALSDNGGFPVYSEWTFGVHVLSSLTMLPIQGAFLDMMYKGRLIGRSLTDNSGFAGYTLRYNFSSTDPFLASLSVRVSYKGVKNDSRYIDIWGWETIPTWISVYKVIIKVSLFKANLVGSGGYGVLSVEGVTGNLLLGYKGYPGYTQNVPLVIANIQKTGHYLKMEINFLIGGGWVKGYLIADLDSKLVYVKAGGLEMYGYLTQ